MSRPSQTESAYVQTVPDGKCLCPDFRAFARLSCVHQTFVRSCPDFRAFMSRFSCVRQTFVRSPDFRAFTRLSCVYVQTFVRSPDFRAFMSRLSCVQQTFVVRSPDFRFVRSSDIRAFTRIFVRSCPDFRAFFLVSRPCKFERTTPPSCVHLGLDISTFRPGPQPGIVRPPTGVNEHLTFSLCTGFVIFAPNIDGHRVKSKCLTCKNLQLESLTCKKCKSNGYIICSFLQVRLVKLNCNQAKHID